MIIGAVIKMLCDSGPNLSHIFDRHRPQVGRHDRPRQRASRVACVWGLPPTKGEPRIQSPCAEWGVTGGLRHTRDGNGREGLLWATEGRPRDPRDVS
jgi:hypothetical protein